MAQERKLKITVDHDVCVGNAMCESFATNTFALNEERQSEAVNPQGDPLAQVLEAADNCPVSAITVVDADTGEQLEVDLASQRLGAQFGAGFCGPPLAVYAMFSAPFLTQGTILNSMTWGSYYSGSKRTNL